MQFLVDVNLPKYFSFFNHAHFFHVADLDPCLTDQQIWDYALVHGYVIITKDSDFYYKCLTSASAPKIIHLQLGNTTLKELHYYFEQHWEALVRQLASCSYILAERAQFTVLF
ncbi:MAG: DUF5615 family PIN-like protein [Bacteroidota bacterium]